MSAHGRETVAAVRHFNLFYTEAVDILSDDHLGSGLALGEARVLFEIARLEPLDATTLGIHLGLDAGYLSRVLKKLKTRKLILVTANAADARVKSLSLSAAGRRLAEALDASSNRAVGAWLPELSDADAATLVDAMATIERLLHGRATIRAVEPDHPGLRACLHAYSVETSERLGLKPGSGLDISVAGDETRPPQGQSLLVEIFGKPVGCGLLRSFAPGIGEIKRMWLHPKTRGQGLGLRLLASLESESRMLGHETLRLDTNERLAAALKLYQKAGYVQIPRYNDSAEPTHWFSKNLLKS